MKFDDTVCKGCGQLKVCANTVNGPLCHDCLTRTNEDGPGAGPALSHTSPTRQPRAGHILNDVMAMIGRGLLADAVYRAGGNALRQMASKESDPDKRAQLESCLPLLDAARDGFTVGNTTGAIANRLETLIADPQTPPQTKKRYQATLAHLVALKNKNMPLHPHMSLLRISPKGQAAKWSCTDCGKAGTRDQLNTISCTKIIEPCPHCGKAPECSEDCPGMMAILGRPDVHVVCDDRKMQEQLIDAEVARFPDTFGLRAFPGETFKINRTACCWGQDGMMLYTARRMFGQWREFSKGRPDELRKHLTAAPTQEGHNDA